MSLSIHPITSRLILIISFQQFSLSSRKNVLINFLNVQIKNMITVTYKFFSYCSNLPLVDHVCGVEWDWDFSTHDMILRYSTLQLQHRQTLPYWDCRLQNNNCGREVTRRSVETRRIAKVFGCFHQLGLTCQISQNFEERRANLDCQDNGGTFGTEILLNPGDDIHCTEFVWNFLVEH